MLDYEVLTLADNAGLRGYLIYCTFERDDLLRGKIVDLFADPADAEGMRSLLVAALRAMKREKVGRVDAFASTAYLVDALMAAGFTPRLSKAGQTQPMTVRGLSVASIHVGQGDGDGG